MITLDEKTVSRLKTLYTEIDKETSKPGDDCDIDIVTENQIQIYDIIKDIIFKKE